MRVCSPVPHPTSNTRPVIVPAAVRAWNAGWGRPMSHGGRLLYRSSGRMVDARCGLNPLTLRDTLSLSIQNVSHWTSVGLRGAEAVVRDHPGAPPRGAGGDPGHHGGPGQ